MARFDCFFRYTGNPGEMFGESSTGTGVALLNRWKEKAHLRSGVECA